MKATEHQPEARTESKPNAEIEGGSKSSFVLPSGYAAYYGLCAGAGAPIQLRKAVVGAAEGSGADSGSSALPSELRTQMEKAFGADFSEVRVRQSSNAGAVGAEAFT